MTVIARLEHNSSLIQSFQLETFDEDFSLLRSLLNDSSVPIKDQEYYNGLSLKLKQYIDDHHLVEEAAKDISGEEDGPRLSYIEYMDQLSDFEVDLIYTAYYDDFILFDYDVWE